MFSPYLGAPAPYFENELLTKVCSQIQEFQSHLRSHLLDLNLVTANLV